MKNKNLLLALSLFLTIILPVSQSFACTNYLVTKSASKDGTPMISYAADSHLLYGELYHWPAKTWPDGTMMKIYEWDTGKYLGKIKQATETYNVVGNVNEYMVAIGETTYGGRPELRDTTGIMDYGSLIYTTLQRAKSARDAIKIMTNLVAEYGYYSSGESFSIADAEEVWILEMIGKGPGNKGAVWVARMIPDGYVSGHANQARITTFPQKGKDVISSKKIDKIYDKNITTVYAEDVIDFARKMKYFTGKDEDFSFSDVYAPVDFGGARFCEIRVWSMFNDVKANFDKKYWEYSKGNIEHGAKLPSGNDNVDKFATNRMPLWIKPDKKVSVLDMFHFMRNHLEGTELDMSKDIGAGPFGNPYRWRPLTWKVGEKTYCNERATATQQTGFSFIAQLNGNYPREIGAINWFGVDDADGTVYMPIFASITDIPHEIKVGNGNITEWSDDAAFWIFNQMMNWSYTRYNLIHPEVKAKQSKFETTFVTEVKNIMDEANKVYKESPEKAVKHLNQYSKKVVTNTVKDWNNMYKQLFVKYSDGNVKTKAKGKENYKYVVPNLEQPGYGEEWYKKIVNETGEQFLMPGGGH